MPDRPSDHRSRKFRRIAEAITGGSLDVGLGSISQIAGAREKGIPYTFFAPGPVYSAESPSGQMMVEKNGPIHTARDLIGKTIGVNNLTSFTQFATLEWLKKNGVDPSSVKFVDCRIRRCKRQWRPGASMPR